MSIIRIPDKETRENGAINYFLKKRIPRIGEDASVS